MKSKSFAGLLLLWCKLNPPLLPYSYSSGKVEGALSAAVHTELFTSLSILLTCRTCHLPVQCLPNRFRCCGITLYSLHKNHDREREIWLGVEICADICRHPTDAFGPSFYFVFWCIWLMGRLSSILIFSGFLSVQELFKKFDKDGNGRPLARAGVTCVTDRFNSWTDWLNLWCFNNLSPKMKTHLNASFMMFDEFQRSWYELMVLMALTDIGNELHILLS